MAVMIRITNVVYSVFVFLFILPIFRPANAYVDPSTGSYVFQIILASAAGIFLLIKNYWNAIRNLFTKKPIDEKNDTNNTK